MRLILFFTIITSLAAMEKRDNFVIIQRDSENHIRVVAKKPKTILVCCSRFVQDNQQEPVQSYAIANLDEKRLWLIQSSGSRGYNNID